MSPSVTQRWIEIVIGRLVTDKALRQKFQSAPRETLLDLVEHGTHLTQSEIAALVAIDADLWERAARHIDLAHIITAQKSE
jgi:hypothetical protein